MADEPEGTYALGVFCTLLHPYLSGHSSGKSGFMKDFFDEVLDDPDRTIEAAGRARNSNPGKSAITAGVWAGMNSTDLPKLYRGVRKIPYWKAAGFNNALNTAAVEAKCDSLGIDALQSMQSHMLSAGIRCETLDQLPVAIGHWLKAILDANAHDRDLLKDGYSVQPELDPYMNVSLAEGRIRNGKLTLHSSSLAWPKPPSVPADPDPELEGLYIRQIYAALSDDAGTTLEAYCQLSDRYRSIFDRQRGFFYDAEGLRRNMRDAFDNGETEFGAMKDDLFDGVVDTCDMNYPNGLERMLTTVSEAGKCSITASVLTNLPSLVNNAHKKGMCHMLVSDGKLVWVADDA